MIKNILPVLFGRRPSRSKHGRKKIMFIKLARSSFNDVFDFPDHSLSFQFRDKTTAFSFFMIFALRLLFLVIARLCQQIIFINNAIAPELI